MEKVWVTFSRKVRCRVPKHRIQRNHQKNSWSDPANVFCRPHLAQRCRHIHEAAEVRQLLVQICLRILPSPKPHTPSTRWRMTHITCHVTTTATSSLSPRQHAKSVPDASCDRCSWGSWGTPPPSQNPRPPSGSRCG